ncbi:hypothetical protein DVH24_018771 [Malus domestica]|uniref:Uncharacterized protein n=1 Tax=Malus domestica TaxID=3750 RepID=A0A498HIX1_MALDO|nr:hypothetical protein DVH24_018771 [Malus domestica]
MIKKGRTTSSFMQSVLDDILLKILIIIAFRSWVSKMFNKIAEDPRIYQHMNITDFKTVNPLKSWGASDTVSKEVKARILELHDDNATIKLCSDYGSPQERHNDPNFHTFFSGRASSRNTHQVASHSFHFLYSAKIVCKNFNQLAQHGWIFKHINNQRFERVNPLTSQSRDEEVYNFLKQCRECNNLEPLYSQGM